jgi:hypothetical protein
MKDSQTEQCVVIEAGERGNSLLDPLLAFAPARMVRASACNARINDQNAISPRGAVRLSECMLRQHKVLPRVACGRQSDGGLLRTRLGNGQYRYDRNVVLP